MTNKSNVPAKVISEALRKECPNVIITSDVTKFDYTIDAIKKPDPEGTKRNSIFDLTLSDLDGKTIRSTSTQRLGNAVKDVCHAIKTAVIAEVVDTQNLTQSVDERRGAVVPPLLPPLIPPLAGRGTHSDTAMMNVIVNGEHALLDCFEHRTGCTTIGPGKYYGELDTDGRSIWVNHEVPLTHKPVRDHYVIAGSW